ncbi:hypothetical protein [Neptunomonas antarctica]|uniref:Uncharacterized protein n=1 Tax=Neptunomonas antarctica TaxID=619304 RepID=A0A1N7J0E7_9GAMM|nr:hypothetical protein [Neptunomonas antarctica]SIS42691.1 hypothetical protein SAMN05421760_101407 [Neptunomonas antarctica]
MNIKALNPAARIAISGFCLSVLMGLIYAMLAIIMSINGGETLVPSLDKVQQKYAGIMIVSAMQGSMYEHVSEDESIEAVRQWVEAGTPESTYESHIVEIMNDDCTNCHSIGSTMTEAMTSIPLTTYQEVIQTTTKGQPWSKIAIQTHTHLFAMSLLVVILGFTLSFTQIFSWIKYLLISFAFLGLWGDALSWTLAKYFAFVGYLIPFTGAMLTGAMAAMAAIILLDCWVKVPLITELAGEK